MTKRDALGYFRQYYATPELRGDRVAQREAWSNYTDALCKAGEITLRQYETWSNPF